VYVAIFSALLLFGASVADDPKPHRCGRAEWHEDSNVWPALI